MTGDRGSECDDCRIRSHVFCIRSHESLFRSHERQIRSGRIVCNPLAEWVLCFCSISTSLGICLLFIQVSQAQELKELKELSLPTVAEELRQQSFWRSFLSSKTYVLTP